MSATVLNHGFAFLPRPISWLYLLERYEEPYYKCTKMTKFICVFLQKGTTEKQAVCFTCGRLSKLTSLHYLTCSELLYSTARHLSKAELLWHLLYLWLDLFGGFRYISHTKSNFEEQTLINKCWFLWSLALPVRSLRFSAHCFSQNLFHPIQVISSLWCLVLSIRAAKIGTRTSCLHLRWKILFSKCSMNG